MPEIVNEEKLKIELFPILTEPAMLDDLIAPQTEWSSVAGDGTPEDKATKREIFAQNSAPTINYKSGDLWFDTDDDNHAYKANDSLVWVSVRDGLILAMSSQTWSSNLTFTASSYRKVDWGAGSLKNSLGTIYAIDAGTTGNVAATTYIYFDIGVSSTVLQTTTTYSDVVGANKVLLVIVSPNSDTAKLAGMSFYTAAEGDTAKLKAIEEAATVGANWATNLTNIPSALFQTFYQATAPVAGMSAGDYWLDSDDNKLYRYSGAAWGEIQDDQIATALSNAATAQSTADSKIVTFIQASAPVATDTGDIWFDNDDNNKPYRWSGAAWVAAEFDVADWSKVFGASKPEDNADVTSTHTANNTSNVNNTDAGDIESRANYPWTKGVVNYFANDGFSSAGVLLRRFVGETYLLTSPGDWFAYVQAGQLAGGATWASDMEFNMTVKHIPTTAQAGFWGLHSAATTIPTTARHIGFYQSAGVLYATNADGATQTTTNISAGITLTAWNNYKFIWDNGTNIKFYINDVLRATHSTNLPSGTTDPPTIHTRATTNGTGTDAMVCKHGLVLVFDI